MFGSHLYEVLGRVMYISSVVFRFVCSPPPACVPESSGSTLRGLVARTTIVAAPEKRLTDVDTIDDAE